MISLLLLGGVRSTGIGALAQLVERCVRNAKVRGSIPLCSTGRSHGERPLALPGVDLFGGLEALDQDDVAIAFAHRLEAKVQVETVGAVIIFSHRQ